MKSLKQQINEGILDTDLDINYDLIQPANVMCEDGRGRWAEEILRANESILAPLAAQKFNAVLDAVKEYEKFRKEYHYTERPILFGQILKLKPKSGEIDKKTGERFELISRFNKWIELAGKTELNRIISGAGDCFFYSNFDSKKPGIQWQSSTPITIDNTLLKKLNSIDSKFEVTNQTSNDESYFITVRTK